MEPAVKYRAKPTVLFAFYALILIAAVLIVGYLFEPLRIGFILDIDPEFYLHVTNLSISIISCLGIGFMWLLYGVKFRYVAGLSAFMAIANLACETAMGFMNTTDGLDAAYGMVGTAICFVFLLTVYKRGLIQLSKKNAGRNGGKLCRNA
jgi:hypothetical protein